MPTGVAAGERPSPRGTHPAGPPLTVTAAGKGLRGSRPHTAPPRMRARAALPSPESPRAAGVSSGPDHVPFTLRGPARRRGTESYLTGTGVLPSRDPKISLKTNSAHEDTGRTFQEARSRPGATWSTSPPHLEREVVRPIGIVGDVVRGEVRRALDSAVRLRLQ